MSRLRMPLLVLLLVASLAALGPPASADPVPSLYDPWPMCGTAPDDDNRYCIASATRNGVTIDPLDCDTPGDYYLPYVDLIGAGDVRFGVDHYPVDGSGCGDILADIPPGDVYRLVVNTGSIRPRELYGHIQDVAFSVGGGPTTGWTFTLEFEPTPIAWMWPPDADGDTFADCSYAGGCGDETTVADLVRDGFVTGYVTDLESSGLTATEIAHRTGYVDTYNAQDAYELYDPDTNAILVRMANPHLRSPGVVATGFYETFLPDAMLINEMNVPDPTTLTTGSFSIARVGVGSVPATVTREPGGIHIKISGISFSTPQYRIRPKPTAPGRPRWGSVERIRERAVKVRFKAPLADGGAAITDYRARCRRGTGDWHFASGPGSPLVVTGLPLAEVSCQVRATNRIGPGVWSTTRQG